MDENRAKEFLVQKSKYFLKDGEVDEALMDELLKAPDSHLPILMKIPFKSPLRTQVYALLFGFLGLDQLYLVERKKCLLKLFTLGGIGYLWIKDFLSARERCREANMKIVKMSLSDINYAKRLIELDMTLKSSKKKLQQSVKKGVKDIGKTFYVR